MRWRALESIAVAFATILVTNLMLGIGSIRASLLPSTAAGIAQANDEKPSPSIAN